MGLNNKSSRNKKIKVVETIKIVGWRKRQWSQRNGWVGLEDNLKDLCSYPGFEKREIYQFDCLIRDKFSWLWDFLMRFAIHLQTGRDSSKLFIVDILFFATSSLTFPTRLAYLFDHLEDHYLKFELSHVMFSYCMFLGWSVKGDLKGEV